MTKQLDKAKNGFVKIAFDRQEVWIDPKELIIEGKSLADILGELDAVSKDYADFRQNTLLTLERLIVNDKQNKANITKQELALQKLAASIVKGGF